jgi:hypothetical protein
LAVTRNYFSFLFWVWVSELLFNQLVYFGWFLDCVFTWLDLSSLIWVAANPQAFDLEHFLRWLHSLVMLFFEDGLCNSHLWHAYGDTSVFVPRWTVWQDGTSSLFALVKYLLQALIIGEPVLLESFSKHLAFRCIKLVHLHACDLIDERRICQSKVFGLEFEAICGLRGLVISLLRFGLVLLYTWIRLGGAILRVELGSRWICKTLLAYVICLAESQWDLCILDCWTVINWLRLGILLLSILHADNFQRLFACHYDRISFQVNRQMLLKNQLWRVLISVFGLNMSVSFRLKTSVRG